MKHQIVLPLPFPAAVVMRALITPQFHVDKARGMGALSCELLEHGEDGTSHFVRIRRRMINRASVPAALAKLTPEQVVLTHRDDWDTASSTGRIEVQIEQVPVRLSAKASVVPTASGCEQRFDWEIHSSIPLVGRMLEKMLAQDLTQAVQNEARIVRDLLAAYVNRQPARDEAPLF
jgi:hypothetical protein